MARQVHIILILLLAHAAAGAQEKVADTLKVGEMAPAVYLRTLEGKDFFLRDYCGTLRSTRRTPQVVVLSFFATWCVPCRAEIPHLMKLQERLKLEDVKVFLIDVGEAPEKVELFVKEMQVTLPVLMDRYSVVSRKYGVDGLPTLAVIGKDGLVKAMWSGYADGDEQKLEALLRGGL